MQMFPWRNWKAIQCPVRISQGFFYRALPLKMCSSKKICAVLMKKLCKSKDYYLVAQGCKKVNSCKNGSYRYELMGETKPEMELLEVVAVICPFSLKAVSTMPSATRILCSFTASLDLMRKAGSSFPFATRI